MGPPIGWHCHFLRWIRLWKEQGEVKIRSEVSGPLPAQVPQEEATSQSSGRGLGRIRCRGRFCTYTAATAAGLGGGGGGGQTGQRKEGRPHLEVGVGDRGQAGDLGVPAAKGRVFPGGKRDWPLEAVSRGHWWPCQEQSGVARAERSRDVGMPTLVGLPAASTVPGPTLSAGNDKV